MRYCLDFQVIFGLSFGWPVTSHFTLSMSPVCTADVTLPSQLLAATREGKGHTSDQRPTYSINGILPLGHAHVYIHGRGNMISMEATGKLKASQNLVHSILKRYMLAFKIT